MQLSMHRHLDPQVKVSYLEKKIVLVIKDDGKGFDVNAVPGLRDKRDDTCICIVYRLKKGSILLSRI